MRWYDHMHHGPFNAPIKRSDFYMEDGKTYRSRPRRLWIEMIRNDMITSKINGGYDFEQNQLEEIDSCSQSQIIMIKDLLVELR